MHAWDHARRTWAIATCPITQMGFVRIVSSPAFEPQASSPRHALDLLVENLGNPRHVFWEDNLRLDVAIPPGEPLTGHKQLTDRYLLALAGSRQAKLATIDRSLAQSAPAHFADAIELVPTE